MTAASISATSGRRWGGGKWRRTYRENTVADSHGGGQDRLYAYDNLNPLIDPKSGDLNAGHTAITTLKFQQAWGLDQVGNWSNFDEDDDGNGSWDIEQQRDHNKVNEIENITETTGPSWATPEYDAVGNTTAFPKPSDLTSNYDATYDAWNRLVRVKDGADTVAEYEYDGRNFRVIKKTYAAGVLDETRHFYYSNQWQVLEERIDGDNDPERQYVWGIRYIDDLVLRDRDTTTSSSSSMGLDERLYALQDANFNVAAVIDVNGDAQERYEYTAYGVRTILTGTFGARGSSLYEWEIGHQGLMHDEDSGLVCNRVRMLHPGMGRFIQRDPVGYEDGMNLYEYERSQVLIALDPEGTRMFSFTQCLNTYSRNLPPNLRKQIRTVIANCAKKHALSSQMAKCIRDGLLRAAGFEALTAAALAFCCYMGYGTRTVIDPCNKKKQSTNMCQDCCDLDWCARFVMNPSDWKKLPNAIRVCYICCGLSGLR